MHQPPLSNHILFQTDRLDCARERVAQKFCSHRLDIVGDRRSFRAAHHHAPGALLSLNYITYGADVLIDPGELEHFYLIQIPIAGAATVRNGKKTVLTDITHASVLNPHWATRMTWWQGCEQVLVQIRKAPFHALAEKLLGRTLDRPVSFDSDVDLARPEMAQWRRLAMAMVRAAGADGNDAPTLTSALCEQQLMEAFFLHQPHDMSFFIDAAIPAAAPVHLRRAEEFLREHAAKPITVSDIAEAAGVSPRTLQLAYKSAYATSPMRALTNERLRRVRYDLLHEDEAKVSDLALKWGFAHLGRFSAAYRNRFGELPRQMVRSRSA